jgi:uncharacterized membrane protein (UPF0127 family)
MNGRLKIFAIFLLLFVEAFVFAVFYHTKSALTEVKISGKTYFVEVAQTSVERQKGLSGHMPLLENSGMLFVFDRPDDYGFWMKDMFFPLDIIWISNDYRVVHLEKNISPDTYPTVYYAGVPVLYVLEISAGQIDKNNIKIGDFLKISGKNL